MTQMLRFAGLSALILFCASVSIPTFDTGWQEFAYGVISVRPADDEMLSIRATQTVTQLTAAMPPTDALFFVGDVLLARNVEYLMSEHGVDYPMRGIDFSALSAKPLVVANFESSIPEVHIPTPSFHMRFSVASEYLAGLSQAGFTHVSLANNHAMDYGTSAFQHTVDTLQQAGLVPFGQPTAINNQSVSFVSVDGYEVALIGLYTLQHTPSNAELTTIFSYASARSDLQVVFIHWGTEYKAMSDEVQQVLAKRLVMAGADLIVGHHPHVVQEVGIVDGVPVLYSLGNHIFDQYKDQSTQEGLLVQLDLEPVPLVRLLPVTSVQTLSQPHLMSESAATKFLSTLAKRSDQVVAREIAQGVLPLHNLVASSAKIVMMGQ